MLSIQSKEYWLKSSIRVILANSNINSIRNKFSSLKELVSNNIDVLVIEETKLYETFLQNLLWYQVVKNHVEKTEMRIGER